MFTFFSLYRAITRKTSLEGFTRVICPIFYLVPLICPHLFPQLSGVFPSVLAPMEFAKQPTSFCLLFCLLNAHLFHSVPGAIAIVIIQVDIIPIWVRVRQLSNHFLTSSLACSLMCDFWFSCLNSSRHDKWKSANYRLVSVSVWILVIPEPELQLV